MSSLLRYAVTPATASPVPTTQRPTAQSPPAKKQKMSLTQTYYLAHTARGKLSKEAAKGDHNLRLLVGHANMLDSLMLELANAEQEQESWFNQTVKSAAKASSEEESRSQRVTWADQHTITEEEMYDEDSESDSDDEEDMEVAVAARKPTAQPMQITLSADEDEEMEDDDEFDANLSLTRTSSHSRSTTHELSPPELMHEDSDSDDSEDDSMPPSPPPTELLISEKARQAIATTSFYQSPSKPIDGSLFAEESQQIAIAAY